MPGDLSLGHFEDCAVDDYADVRGRAAHIEGHDMTALGFSREVGTCDDAGSRTREQCLVRVTRTERDAHQAAVRLHQESLWCANTVRIKPFFQANEIVGDAWSDVGVNDRRRKPWIFADHRQYFA